MNSGIAAAAIGSLVLRTRPDSQPVATFAQITDLPGFEIPYSLIAGVAAASAGFLIFMVGMMARSRGRRVVSGREEMIGAVGEALGDFETEGWARVHGEQWKVRPSRPVRRGQKLRVTAIQGLVLSVEPQGD